MYRNVVIDNCSINKVHGGPALKQKFLEIRQKNPFILSIPAVVMDENVDGDDELQCFDRIRTIATITGLDGNIELQETSNYWGTPKEFWAKEVKTRGAAKTPPLLRFDQLDRSVFSDFEKFILAKRQIHEGLTQDRSLTLQFQREHQIMADSIRSKNKREDLISDFENFRPLDSRSKIARDLFTKEWATGGFSKTRYLKALSANARYKYIYTYANLLAFTLARWCLPTDYRLEDRYGNKIQKMHKNDISDLVIAAQASYSDFLITEDRTLLEVCSRLQTIGVATFKTLTIENFISDFLLPLNSNHGST